MSILSFDVGGSSIKFAVMEEDGRIEEKGSVPTPDNIESFYKELQNVKESFAEKYTFEGAAFSLPGAVDDENGVIGGFSAVEYIHNFKIKDALSEKLSLPISMENDANCAALGEVWLGAAKECEDAVFMVVGTGIGGAVVKNRKVHKGKHLHGGEFGYMLLDSDSYQVLSGAASTISMAKKIAEEKGLPEESVNGKIAFEMLEQGDEVAKKHIDKMYEYIARGIFNIQYVYDPEVVVIGGGISERPDFVDNINKHLKDIIAGIGFAKIYPEVRRCQFGNDANLIGAVYNFLN